MPDPLDFTFEDFEITLYSELDCILSESQGDFIIILNVPLFYMKMGNNSLIPGRILEKSQFDHRIARVTISHLNNPICF